MVNKSENGYRVYVDCSIFTPEKSVGVISGHLWIENLLHKGDKFPLIRLSDVVLDSHGEIMTAEPRIERIRNGLFSKEETSYYLEDLTFYDVLSAMIVVQFLSQSRGLFFDNDVVDE